MVATANNPKTVRPSLFSAKLGHDRCACDACGSEYSPVTFHFLRRAERFRVVVGEFYCRASFNGRHFADQADGIETGAVIRIAAAKIVGQQRSPAGAEADAALRSPLAAVSKISRTLKIARA